MHKQIAIILSLIPTFYTMSQSFTVQPIPESIAAEMLQKGTIAKEAPVQLDRLRIVQVQYVDFDGNTKDGSIIVMDAVAESVKNLFKELYSKKFPLERVELVTNYDGDDDRSMAANNTSSHNYRKVAGTTRLSLHSYGTAIDINPVQNPYILFDEKSATTTYLPPNSLPYANRMIKRLDKPDQVGYAEEVVDVFARHGFYWWGGYWDTPIDFQHFQLDRDVSYVLAEMNTEEATWFFELLKNYYNEHQEPLESILQAKAGKDLLDVYRQNPKDFRSWVMANY